jgi:competence protein ComEA
MALNPATKRRLAHASALFDVRAEVPIRNRVPPYRQEITMFRKFIAAMLATLALNAFAAVDINRASRAELETVKGIGPGLSAKILKAREAGEFRSWSDMVQRVPGVGGASAGKLSKAGLTVGGAPLDASTLPPATTKAKSPGKKATDAATGAEPGKVTRRAERKVMPKGKADAAES